MCESWLFVFLIARFEEEDIIRVSTRRVLGKHETVPHNRDKLCLFFLEWNKENHFVSYTYFSNRRQQENNRVQFWLEWNKLRNLQLCLFFSNETKETSFYTRANNRLSQVQLCLFFVEWNKESFLSNLNLPNLR